MNPRSSIHSAEEVPSWPVPGNTASVPPASYWDHLANILSGDHVEQLRQLSDRRVGEFKPDDLRPPLDVARTLLARVVDDGWLRMELRSSCPNCNRPLTDAEAMLQTCPNCTATFADHGGVTEETIFTRSLAPVRNVDWVVAIHGMNTAGAWQEELCWLLSTTWGHSVPVAVYKYGIVRLGVILPWRRRKMLRGLREKVATLRTEAQTQGYTGRPDVVAHSFGTWLLGHLLQDELLRDKTDQLCVGRVILTGCVLRPDFDWERLRGAGLVDAVLNHYGTADLVVPLAHITIANAGPSGRRGFDGNSVLNVPARGFGHSDLFSTRHRVVAGRGQQSRQGARPTHLTHSYLTYWRPFLTLPIEELVLVPDIVEQATRWRPAPWLLRGTLFPLIALPLVASLSGAVLATLGNHLRGISSALWRITGVTSLLLLALLMAATVVAVFQRGRGMRSR